MASSIMHICVAKKVNEYLNLNEKELFLGTIAPDISKHINQPKTESHFMSLRDNIPNINEFINKYSNQIKTPFDYGYFIHLYTDKVWQLNIMDKLTTADGNLPLNNNLIIKDEKLKQKTLYDEYTNMNVKLIDEYNLDLSLFYEEFEMPDTCIKEIPVNKLNVLIDATGSIVINSNNYENKVFDYNTIVEFINNTADEIKEFLKENSL